MAMKMDVAERSVAVLVGMAAGYVLWLAGITALTALVPMQRIIIAAAVFLGPNNDYRVRISQPFQKVRETLYLAGLLVGTHAARGSQPLLPYRFSELTRKNLTMIKPDTTLAPINVEVRDER